MIKIYGAAHQKYSGNLLDYEGEVSASDIATILSEPLTWDKMDLKSPDETEEECECNWLVELDGKEIVCETNSDLQALLTVQSRP